MRGLLLAVELSYTTPAARSRPIFAFGIRRSCVRISSVCWPSRGCATVAAPRLPQRRTGTPIKERLHPVVPDPLQLLSGSRLGGIDHANPEAAPIEAAIASEQRIGLLGRVGTDQEIGDETVAGWTGGPPAFPP